MKYARTTTRFMEKISVCVDKLKFCVAQMWHMWTTDKKSFFQLLTTQKCEQKKKDFIFTC